MSLISLRLPRGELDHNNDFKEKTMKKTWLGATMMATGLLLSGNTVALEDSSRNQTWEASFRISSLQGDSYKGQNGSSAETDNSVGWGFGFGYNVNENLVLGGNFNWADIDYSLDAKGQSGNPDIKGNGTLETSTLSFNGTYNILRKAVTPFVTGGIGATYVDTNIPNAAPYPVCWYDPWYGYYCGTVVPTKDETNFSYSIGAGVRWDVTQTFFMRASANRLWIDASGNVGHPDFVSYGFDFGLRFW
jgi:opacity protein-like surface antigen